MKFSQLNNEAKAVAVDEYIKGYDETRECDDDRLSEGDAVYILTNDLSEESYNEDGSLKLKANMTSLEFARKLLEDATEPEYLALCEQLIQDLDELAELKQDSDYCPSMYR